MRDPQEYAAGHLAGAVSAPGGQLVQATDLYVGMLNARLVLVDDEGVRALMTGSWLKQMGWPEVLCAHRGGNGNGMAAAAGTRRRAGAGDAHRCGGAGDDA